MRACVCACVRVCVRARACVCVCLNTSVRLYHRLFFAHVRIVHECEGISVGSYVQIWAPVGFLSKSN